MYDGRLPVLALRLSQGSMKRNPISLTLDVPPPSQTYPDEDESVGVPHSVLPLRYLDHGELHWACAMADEALHL